MNCWHHREPCLLRTCICQCEPNWWEDRLNFLYSPRTQPTWLSWHSEDKIITRLCINSNSDTIVRKMMRHKQIGFRNTESQRKRPHKKLVFIFTANSFVPRAFHWSLSTNHWEHRRQAPEDNFRHNIGKTGWWIGSNQQNPNWIQLTNRDWISKIWIGSAKPWSLYLNLNKINKFWI